MAHPAPAIPAADPTLGREAVPRPGGRLGTGSWMLYDLANTSFSLGIVTVYFPQLVQSTHGRGADFVVGMLDSAAALIVLVLAPVLGALSDQAGRRLPFLVVTTVLCVGSTFLMGLPGLTGAFPLFVAAVVCFQCGLIFYDALLPDVSTEENRGRVGGMGVAIGYGGSLLAILVGVLVLPAVPGPEDFGTVFRLLAALFLVAALPAFLFVRERPRVARPLTPGLVGNAFRQLADTVRRSRRYRGLPRFLLGRAMYTDAANTLVVVVVLVATGMGLPPEEARLIGVPSILAAIAAGAAWGIAVDRLGPRRVLGAVLRLWLATLLLAAAVPMLGLPLELLWLVSVMMGIALAGTWASDRPLMARISPPARYGEFFGLYAMVGRASAVVGPLVFALVAPTAGQPVVLLLLAGVVVAAMAVIGPVDDAPREWGPEDLPATAGQAG